MNESWLQVRDHEGDGFRPLISYGSWRVAMLRPRKDSRAEGLTTMERHTQTDEVFVLMRGVGILLIGGAGARLEGVYPTSLHQGKVYNVRCNVWHAVLLSPDASVLIVEQDDTTETNSEYLPLSTAQLDQVKVIAAREGLA